MTNDSEQYRGIDRYRSLELIANPFSAPVTEGWGQGTLLEVAAASNRLLAALAAAGSSKQAKPIMVTKGDVPSSYSLRAISNVQLAMGNDESLNVLHAYIQLYMMRTGRVRSTLGAVGERVAFRSFDETLAAHIETVLDEPDDQLAAFQLLGAEGLSEFADLFAADPLEVTREYFGTAELERQPELAQLADVRVAGLEADIEESEDSAEVDKTIGDAVGTAPEVSPEEAEDLKRQAVVDYVIEHTSTHLSKVVARGLRVYRDRGLAALSTELRVTKAPRKTLNAVARLATTRFDKLAIIYDSFENWMQIAPDLRQTIVVTLNEMRWMLQDDAVFVFLLDDGGVPELEEQFAAGTQIKWDFPGLMRFQDAPDEIAVDLIDSWLEAASTSETPLTMGDPVLAELAKEAQGSLTSFVTLAAAAIEDAASRKSSALDGDALEAGRHARAETTAD